MPPILPRPMLLRTLRTLVLSFAASLALAAALLARPMWAQSAALALFPITAQGAIGDGTTLNTRAIQATIDAAAAAGGGTVVVPTGVFQTGALFLRQGVALRVDQGGKLLGSDRLEDYLPAGASVADRSLQPFALINATDLAHVVVSGAGTIDGHGRRWWTEYWKLRNARDPDLAFKTRRPRLLHFTSCHDLTLSGLELCNEAVWCVHLQFCENVLAENLNIHAAHDAPSSDGIDIDSSRHVRITGCTFDVDDDDISIKAGHGGDPARVNRPSEDILIEHCHFAYGHGGIDIGSETFGGIRHVVARDCTVDSGNLAAIRFKTTPARSGVVEDIVFRNITLHHVRQALEINMDWRSGTSKPETPAKVPPVFRNFRLIHVTGDADSIGVFHGLATSPLTDVTFSDCALTANRGLVLEHAESVSLAGLTLTVKDGPAVTTRSSSPTP